MITIYYGIAGRPISDFTCEAEARFILNGLDYSGDAEYAYSTVSVLEALGKLIFETKLRPGDAIRVVAEQTGRTFHFDNNGMLQPDDGNRWYSILEPARKFGVSDGE